MNDPRIAIGSIELRPGPELGRTVAGGLQGIHHFCFATYQRPDRLEWGSLRAFNEYSLSPGAVRHPTFHSGFDIVTLVTGGNLRRRGTFSPRQLLTAGSVELVSAGRGVELGMEAVGRDAATYFEIWIRTGPGRREPRREWLASGRLGPGGSIATGDPYRHGALRLRAPAEIAFTALRKGADLDAGVGTSECAYVSVRSGSVDCSGVKAQAGDALAITGQEQLVLRAETTCTLLLIRTAKSFEDAASKKL